MGSLSLVCRIYSLRLLSARGIEEVRYMVNPLKHTATEKLVQAVGGAVIDLTLLFEKRL